MVRGFIRAHVLGARLQYYQNNDDSDDVSCFHLIKIVLLRYGPAMQNKKINPSEIHVRQGVYSHRNNATNRNDKCFIQGNSELYVKQHG